MRIVGGVWRSRVLKAPKGSATRPTTDRVRESLFSSLASRLGSDLGGAAVLDPFAGSGALALEALSRGARSATLVERDHGALSALRDNIATLQAKDRTHVLSGDAFSLARQGMPGGPFSLILLDPPYTLDPAEVGRMLERLAASGSVASGAVVAWERASGASCTWPVGFEVASSKRYGTTAIDIGIYEGEPSR